MTAPDQPAYVPDADEASNALRRANRIVWTSWVVATLVVVGAWVNGRVGGTLTGLACVVLVFVQDDAIKAARSLGHGRRHGR